MLKSWGLAAAVLFVAACSNPCHDYCEDFVKKSHDCGLGGPSGDSEIDSCGDQMEKIFTDDVCETADDGVKKMSCEEFKTIVCDGSAESSQYKCD